MDLLLVKLIVNLVQPLLFSYLAETEALTRLLYLFLESFLIGSQIFLIQFHCQMSEITK